MEPSPAWPDYFREMARTALPPLIIASPEPIDPPSTSSSTAASALETDDIDGFIVHSSTGPVGVQWDHFLAFVCSPDNVAHLPPQHPMALFARLARERQVASTLPSSNEVSPVDAQPSYLWSAPPATAQPTRLADATPRAAPVAPRPYAQAPVQSQQPRPMIPHPYQEVYIWSARHEKLWRLDSAEGQQAVGDIANRLLVFPANSTIAVRDRDGSLASPAWSSCHGSNAFLKGQRCGQHCPYAAGFGNKRPVLIREHLRRCTSLPADHPLKVLSTLELEAHARQTAASGGHKRKRRSSGASTPRSSRSSVPPAPQPPPQPQPLAAHDLAMTERFDPLELDAMLNSFVVDQSAGLSAPLPDFSSIVHH